MRVRYAGAMDPLQLLIAGIIVVGVILFVAAFAYQRGRASVSSPSPRPVRHGVSRAPMAAPGTWEVVLQDTGERRIEVIKILREATGLGLADAKRLSEQVNVIVVSQIDQATADYWVDVLGISGASAYAIDRA